MTKRQDMATPYHVEVSLISCKCAVPATLLSRCKRYDSAVKHAEGYWAVYLGFFGHLTNIIRFSIVDTRDGTVLWRNGRHEPEGKTRANEGN